MCQKMGITRLNIRALQENEPIENNSVTDTNECRTQPGLCQYDCRNTDGGFQCLCPPGFKLHSSGRGCIGELVELQQRGKGLVSSIALCFVDEIEGKVHVGI